MKHWRLYIALVAFILLLAALNIWPEWNREGREASITQLYSEIASGNVSRMKWQGENVTAQLKDGNKLFVRAFETRSPAGRDLIEAAVKGKADLQIQPKPAAATLLPLLGVVGMPIVILVLLWFFLSRVGVQRHGQPPDLNH